MTPLYISHIMTPIGGMVAFVDTNGALTRLDFCGARSLDEIESRLVAAGIPFVHDAARCAHVTTQIEEYFRGERRAFDIPLAPEGSEFQQRVWEELCRIPFGATISYGELANRLGSPTGSRAVGRANATNPIALVIPCHRVIGADGALTGYAGGLDIKQHLLAHEGVIPQSLW